MQAIDSDTVNKRELLNNFAKCIGELEPHLVLSGQPPDDSLLVMRIINN